MNGYIETDGSKLESLRLAIGLFQASGLYKVGDELGDDVIKLATKFADFLKEKN